MKGQRRPHADRGSAAVEFALVLPVLLLIIFGIIDFGRMLAAKITLTEAAREGARATALIDSDAGQARVAAAAADITPAPTATITACPSPAGSADDATVVVSYQFHFVTPLAILAGLGGAGSSGAGSSGDGSGGDGSGGDGTVTLTATGVMPCVS
jgi:Flp pilus assembly protein TadG